jgi:hypothetical protein
VLDCTKAERWAAALWYLDRLIAARPKDWSLYLDRAAVYGKLGRDADRQAELTRVFELGADEGVVIPRAEELGRAGRWNEAASMLAGCGRPGPLSQQLAQAWAIACLQAKDYAGYRETCAADLAWQGSDPTVDSNALSAASVFALGAKGLDDYRVPIAWLERRLSAVPAPRPVGRHYSTTSCAGWRLGSWLTKLLDRRSRPPPWSTRHTYASSTTTRPGPGTAGAISSPPRPRPCGGSSWSKPGTNEVLRRAATAAARSCRTSKRLRAVHSSTAELLIEEVAQSLECPTVEQITGELGELNLLTYCQPILTRHSGTFKSGGKRSAGAEG